eukprot:COSAG01_NODE_4826_length_4712_cov_21.963148_1_plen_32_part_10
MALLAALALSLRLELFGQLRLGQRLGSCTPAV